MIAATLALFFEATVRAATPLALAAVGETVAERAGIINLGIEGALISGAFGALVGATAFGLVGGVIGALVAALLPACSSRYLSSVCAPIRSLPARR